MTQLNFEKIYRDEDVSLAPLKGKTVAIIGYGSQGRAQSLCMRDSGIQVIVADDPAFDSWTRAHEDGFEVFTTEEAIARADIVHILLPDPQQPSIYSKHIHEHLKPGQVLSFAHGFAVLYGTIKPPKDLDVILFVPNGPGPVVRQKYENNSGIYGCVGVSQNVSGEAHEVALAIAKAVGSCRVGVISMSFQHETEGDNYEEQVLYGGTIHLMRTMYKIMVKNGYPRSFAYAKAIRSLRSIVDDIDEVGIEEYLSTHASRTCEFAVRHSGPRVVNEEEMEKIFKETEMGIFARNWLVEFNSGMPTLNRLRQTWADSDMEQTGKIWREMFGK